MKIFKNKPFPKDQSLYQSFVCVNQYIKNIKPYLAASHKIWSNWDDMKVRPNILKLDWNEATIAPSPKVISIVKKLATMADFYNLYPNTNNTKLLQLISDYTSIPTANILYFPSSDTLHECIAKTYIKEGKRVLIQAPSYDNFRLTAEAGGGKLYFSEPTTNFEFNEKKFKRDIKKYAPHLVYICSPNNPLGYLNSKIYIEKLLKRFPKTMFVVDEAYAEFARESVKDLVLKYNNILVTRTLSKAFALANLRFGYLLSSEFNVSQISKIRNCKSVSTFTQEAAAAALSDIPYMQNYVDTVLEAKKYFLHKMRKYRKHITAYPSYANFVVLKCPNFEFKMSLLEYLSDHNIYIRNLSQSPILKECVRVTIGNTSQMERVFNAIEVFLKMQGINTNRGSAKLALFDFCETLVPFQSADKFISYIKEQSGSSVMKAKDALRKTLLKTGIIGFLEKKLRYSINKKLTLWQLKGFPYETLDTYAKTYYENSLKPFLMSETLQKLLELKQQGYQIYVASGGYDIYLKYFVEDFKLDGFFSTKIAFKNGICKGCFDGLDCMGPNKLIFLKKVFNTDDFQDIIGFSDSITDLPMLNWCERAVFVHKGNASNLIKKYDMEEIVCH